MKNQKKLIKYVSEFLAPFDPNHMDQKEVYAHVIEENVKGDAIKDEDDADSEILLKLELMTVESIRKDNEFFCENKKDCEYEPFSYVFTVLKQNDDMMVREACGTIVEGSKGGWIKGKLLCKGKSVINGCLSLSIGLLSNEDGYSEYEVQGVRVPVDVEAAFVPDTISESVSGDCFCASENDSDMKLHDVLRECKNSLIQSIHGPFPDRIRGLGKIKREASVQYRVKIYKVGHANTVSIENDRSDKDYRCILFDCGKSSDKYKRTVDVIKHKLKPTTLIISHWHGDHFSLVEEIDTSRLKLIIVPTAYEFKMADSIKKTLCFLNKKGVKIVALRSEFDLKRYGYNRIKIFLGENNQLPDQSELWDEDNTLEELEEAIGRINYSRTVDDSGIIMSIAGKKYHAILPGDCAYYSWPDSKELEFEGLNRLIIPHHGGKVLIPEPGRDRRTKTDLVVYVSNNTKVFYDHDDKDGKTYQCTFIHNICKGNKLKVLFTEECKNTYYWFKI